MYEGRALAAKASPWGRRSLSFLGTLVRVRMMEKILWFGKRARGRGSDRELGAMLHPYPAPGWRRSREAPADSPCVTSWRGS